MRRIHDGTICNNAAKQVFEALWTGEGSRGGRHHRSQGPQADERLRRAGEAIIDEVIAANADNVAQYRAGKDKAFNALVGQVMKASKGKANPQQVNDLLRAKLSA